MAQGCAGFQKTTSEKPLVKLERLENPQQLSSWQTQGKVAFRKANEGGHANFTWQQDKQHFLIRLTGPISSGGVVIEGQPGHVELRDQAGNVWTADSPEALMEQRLGWRLPIDGMKYWIKGIAQPGVPKVQQKNTANTLTELHQSGWIIHYQNYQVIHNYALPQRMTLNNDIFNLKVMIREWKFL